jgi:hypothetical protein
MAGLPGLRLALTAPVALNKALACSRRAISASILARISFTMVRFEPPIEEYAT